MKFALAFGIFFVALAQAIATEPVLFEQTIRPILKQHCWHCHGEEPKLEGGFDARLAKYLTRGGESGSAIEPGDHQKSLLYQRIADHEMPPGDKKVTEQQMKLIAAWIDQVREPKALNLRTLPSATLFWKAIGSTGPFRLSIGRRSNSEKQPADSNTDRCILAITTRVSRSTIQRRS